jgi:hypothetical protein
MSPNHLVVASVIASMLSASGTSAFAQVQAPTAAPPAPMPPPPVAQPAVPDQPPAPYPGQYPPPGYPPPGYPPGQPYYPYVPQNVAPPWAPRFITDWQQGNPIPYGYHPVTRARRGLVIAGSIVFGATYLYTAALASESPSSSRGDESWLYLPVLGPLVQMTQTDSRWGTGVLTLDALAQAAGVAMFISGFVFPRTILVRNDLASMTVVPMKIGLDGSGLGFVGRF